jgi:hypothetical protein
MFTYRFIKGTCEEQKISTDVNSTQVAQKDD